MIQNFTINKCEDCVKMAVFATFDNNNNGVVEKMFAIFNPYKDIADNRASYNSFEKAKNDIHYTWQDSNVFIGRVDQVVLGLNNIHDCRNFFFSNKMAGSKATLSTINALGFDNFQDKCEFLDNLMELMDFGFELNNARLSVVASSMSENGAFARILEDDISYWTKKVELTKSTTIFKINKNDLKVFRNLRCIDNSIYMYINEETGVKENLGNTSSSSDKIQFPSNVKQDLENDLFETFKPMLDKASSKVNEMYKRANQGERVDEKQIIKEMEKILPSFVLNNCSLLISGHTITEGGDEENSPKKKINVTDSIEIVCDLPSNGKKGKWDIVNCIVPFISKSITSYCLNKTKAYSNNDSNALHYVALNTNIEPQENSVFVPDCISKTFGCRMDDVSLTYLGAFAYKCMHESIGGRQTLVLFNQGKQGTSTAIDMIDVLTDGSVFHCNESDFADSHGLEGMLDKKILALKDVTKTKDVFTSSGWRSLSSMEDISVNPKGKKVVKLNATGIKCVVSTNYPIYASTDEILTRLLPVALELKQGANGFVGSKTDLINLFIENIEAVKQWACECYGRLKYLNMMDGSGDFVLVPNSIFNDCNSTNKPLTDELKNELVDSLQYLKEFDIMYPSKRGYLKVGVADDYDAMKSFQQNIAIYSMCLFLDDCPYVLKTKKGNNAICLENFTDCVEWVQGHLVETDKDLIFDWERRKKAFNKVLNFDKDKCCIEDSKSQNFWRAFIGFVTESLKVNETRKELVGVCGIKRCYSTLAIRTAFLKYCVDNNLEIIKENGTSNPYFPTIDYSKI